MKKYQEIILICLTVVFAFALILFFPQLSREKLRHEKDIKDTPPKKSIKEVNDTGDSKGSKSSGKNGLPEGSQSEKDTALIFKFMPGKQLKEKFNYNFSTDYTLKFGGKPEEEKTIVTSITAGGELVTTCYKSQEQLNFIGCKLENLSMDFSGDGKHVDLQSDIKDDFNKEIFLEKDRFGEISSIYFPNLNVFVRNFWQQLFYINHLVFPKDGSTTWQLKGENTMGTYVASFKRTEEAKQTIIYREITDYTEIKYQTPGQTAKLERDKYKINILENRTKYSFDRKIGYPAKTSMTDSCEINVEQNFNFRASYKSTWTSEITGLSQLDPQKVLDQLFTICGAGSLEEIKKSMRKSVVGEAFVYSKKVKEEEKAKAPEKFIEILKTIRSMSEIWDSQKASKLFQEASELAKISPKILEIISSQLKEGDNINIKGFLTDVLADVGTKDAQSIIKSVFTDASLPPELRERAIFSSMFVKSPEDFFRNSVVDVFQNPAENPDVKKQALRCLGAVAYKFTESNPEIANQMLDYLVSYKSQASGEDQKIALIDAFANTNMETVVPYLKDFLDKNESLNVRTAAIATIARRNSDAALNLVIDEVEKTSEMQIVNITLGMFLRKNWDTSSESTKKKTLKTLESIFSRYDDNRIKEMVNRLRKKIGG